MIRSDIRNVAIIAHVDHGKTTLVDGMIRQAFEFLKAQNPDAKLPENFSMDSGDLERERGITIKAKNASLYWNGIKINIVDTPGHADFGGEVERTLKMVDGVLLLVDAKEGPMPQTKFVLRKALQLGLKPIVVVNKIDRPDAQIENVVNRTFDLFVELNATSEQLDFPIIYAAAKQGVATLDMKSPGTDLVPIFETIIEEIPAPNVDTNEPLQILVLALAYDQFKGKMGIGRISAGSIKKGQQVAEIKIDGTIAKAKVTDLLAYQGLVRKEIDSAEAGEIVAVAGLENIAIGETIADVDRPMAITPVAIDAPTVQMTIGVNTSPFNGREGKLVTSRAIRDRLMKELETNVSMRVEDTESPETMLVSGRGELHLAILIETMRREGFEVQVSQPRVIFKEVDGKKLEPFETLIIECPKAYQGAIIEEVAKRKGELANMSQNEIGELQFEYVIPTRGLIGLKSSLMTKTKGTTIINSLFLDYRPVVDGLETTPHGSLIASESGTSSSYGLDNAQQRGSLFYGSGIDVYEGQVVGENSRAEDLEINICKAKKLTNMRSSGADDALVLTPPREITLEYAIEYVGGDELLEVTPKSLRIRKRFLKAHERKNASRRES
ncbi:MAG: translational GTPase TypA [bacterium]